jgi:hypothetical protein
VVAYVLTKLAVGIFAGGVVFAVLIPDIEFMGLDSFWIGSILVIILTGIYTIMGGMRAVAYTSAIQTVILVVGSAFVTYFGLKALGGWGALREWAVQRCSTCGSRSCRMAWPAPGRRSRNRAAWRGTSTTTILDRHAFLRADRRTVVLVYRPVHRAACARRAE